MMQVSFGLTTIMMIGLITNTLKHINTGKNKTFYFSTDINSHNHNPNAHFFLFIHVYSKSSHTLLVELCIHWLYPPQERGRTSPENRLTLSVRLTIRWFCNPCNGVTPQHKKGLLSVTLTSIWWWGSNSEDLGRVEYHFIAITPGPPWSRVDLLEFMSQTDMFKNIHTWWEYLIPYNIKLFVLVTGNSNWLWRVVIHYFKTGKRIR